MKRVLRYEVPLDDQPHEIDVAGVVLHVGTRAIGVGALAQLRVDFWTEARDGEATAKRSFRVYGTGHSVPDDAMWVGTAPRTPEGFVWHLFEMPGGGE